MKSHCLMTMTLPQKVTNLVSSTLIRQYSLSENANTYYKRTTKVKNTSTDDTQLLTQVWQTCFITMTHTIKLTCEICFGKVNNMMSVTHLA